MSIAVKKLKDGWPSRLIYLPYAGGNAASCHYLKPHLTMDVALYGVEPPGHGMNFAPLLDDYDRLFANYVEGLLPYLQPPYVLMGYSLGGLMAYDLMCYLQSHNLPAPEFGVIAATVPPQLMAKVQQKKGWHQMTDEEILSDIMETGGVAKELQTDLELLRMFIPVYRADSRVFHSFSHRNWPLLRTPLKIFGGTADEDIPPDSLEEWKKSGNDVTVTLLEGGHMFLTERGAELGHTITRSLEQLALTSKEEKWKRKN